MRGVTIGMLVMAAGFGAAGCASQGNSAAAAAAPVQVAAAEAPADVAADGEDKVICRKIEETGSRLRAQKVCLPASEWDRRANSAKGALKGIQDKGVQPGGERLGP